MNETIKCNKNANLKFLSKKIRTGKVKKLNKK